MFFDLFCLLFPPLLKLLLQLKMEYFSNYFPPKTTIHYLCIENWRDDENRRRFNERRRETSRMKTKWRNDFYRLKSRQEQMNLIKNCENWGKCCPSSTTTTSLSGRALHCVLERNRATALKRTCTHTLTHRHKIYDFPIENQ